jgi:hypothetical protein
MNRASDRGPKTFDAVAFGYYEGSAYSMPGAPGTDLHRNCGSNFTGASTGWRYQTAPSPIYPKSDPGRWGVGLTAEKMEEDVDAAKVRREKV